MAQAGTQLFSMMTAANPLRFVDYRKQAISRKIVLRYVEELAVWDKHFGKNSFQPWISDLSAHNRTTERASRLKLLPCSVQSIQCSSLDKYMLCFRCDDIIGALHGLCRFGRKLNKRIRSRPRLPAWSVCGAIVITKQRWILLCLQVLSMVDVLNACINNAISQDRAEQPQLRDAIMQVTEIYDSHFSISQHLRELREFRSLP
mmetsp:Transcript_62658/g.167953  ORF Transcript_62658/g.167953 Transcript_62658/m.167953 type:complete len:203 (-) Transcript_62658:13-621(-)